MKYLFAITSACILMFFSSCGNRDQETYSGSLTDEQIEHFELTIVDSIGIATGDSNYVFGVVPGAR